MPNALATVIAKVIVGAIAGATGVAVGSVAAGVVVSVYAASIIASLAIISAVAKSFQPDMPSDNADMKRDIVLRGGTEARKIVYGEAVVGGVLVYSNITGPENAYLVTGVAHAGHQVYNMTDVYFDDDVIAQAEIGNSAGAAGTLSTYDDGWTTGTTGPHTGQNALVSGKYYKAGDTWVLLDRYTGLETQTASSFLTQFSDFDASDRGRGICYSVYHLVLNEQSEKVWESGSPRNYKSKIQGKIVYNPALDVTAGAWIIANGFDPYSVYTETYKEYSTNPILCAVDYMIDNQNGMGISPAKIDWDEVVSEAAFCDKPVANSVTGERESRFTCNGVLSTFDTHKVNLMRLMSACNGNMAYKNGKWFIKAGRFSQGNTRVTNGSFASGNTGWTKFGTGTAAESSGRLECIATSGNKVGRYQQLTGLTAGFLYTVSGLAENTDGVSGAIGEINVTTAAGDTGTVLGGASFGVLAADGNHEFEFIATGTTAYLNLFVNASVSGTVYFDNVEAYSLATKTLTSDWLRDTIGVQTSLTKQERFNETKAFYFSSAETYKQVQSLEVYSAVNLSRDNQEVLTRELNLPMTNTEDEAQRIQYKLLKMNERQVRLSVPCNYLALDLAVNDRVMVTIDELGYTQKVFLVESWTLVDAQGGVDLTLIEDDADYWRDPDTNDYSTRTDTGVLVPATPEVPPPTSVTLTARTGLPDMIVSWNDPEPSTYYDMAQVYRATTNSFGAATALVDIRTNTYTDTTATAGVNYYYWVRSRKGREFSAEVATSPTNSTAAAINAATATNVNWSGVINDGNGPADNATVGGQLGTNVTNESSAPINDLDALNQYPLTEGMTGLNYNAFCDITRPDGTPAGYYLGQGAAGSDRTDFLQYEDATNQAIKLVSTTYRPMIVTTPVRVNKAANYRWAIRMKSSVATTVDLLIHTLDANDLGTGIVTFCQSPSNNDSEVTTASRTPISGSGIAVGTSYSYLDLSPGAPWYTSSSGALTTYNTKWMSASIQRNSSGAAANIFIDTCLIYEDSDGAVIKTNSGTLSGTSDEFNFQFALDNANDNLYFYNGSWKQILLEGSSVQNDMTFDSGVDLQFQNNSVMIKAKDTSSTLRDVLKLNSLNVLELGNSAMGGIQVMDNLLGTTISGFTTIQGTSLSGTLLTASQPNVTNVGSLTALTVSASGVNINISNTSESTSGLNVYDSAAPTTQFMHLDYDASANNCLFNTPSGGWHLRVAGVNKFTVGTSDVTLPATNLRLAAGNARATHAASTGYVFYGSATNASYSSEIVQTVATRSASSSFKFLATRSSAGADIEHNLRGDGNGYCDGAWTGGGADFAEFMEWVDGNPDNEDRTGMVVQFSKPKNGHPYIEQCTEPKKAIGVVSAMPTIVGGSDWNKWQGKYLKNKYGGYLIEQVDYYIWTEQRVIIPESNIEAQKRIDEINQNEELNSDQDLLEEKAKLMARLVPEANFENENVEASYPVDAVPSDVVIPNDAKIETIERRVLNLDWDEELAKNHTAREDRPEWAQVGINGFVVINDEEVTAARWKKVGPCGEGVSRWLIR